MGGEKDIEVDVRVVAATNRDLEKEVAEGRFREDLFYRLNVIRIQMPSLREIKDDIPLLMHSFLKEFAEENNKQIKGFDSKSKAAMVKYSWPGNIRELRNCVESAVVMCNGDEIKVEDLPHTLQKTSEEKSIIIPMGITLEEAEMIIINENLAFNNGNKSKTADVLGIGRKTLHRKLGETDEE